MRQGDDLVIGPYAGCLHDTDAVRVHTPDCDARVALRGDHARSIPRMDAAGADAANAVVTSTLQRRKCPSSCLGSSRQQRQSRVEALTAILLQVQWQIYRTDQVALGLTGVAMHCPEDEGILVHPLRQTILTFTEDHLPYKPRPALPKT